MTDISKIKLQLRTSLTKNSPDRMPTSTSTLTSTPTSTSTSIPTPPAKLMINHGKPNFTLPRFNAKQNGYRNRAPSPIQIINNNDNNDNNNNISNGNLETTTNGMPYKAKPVVKSSTFYGLQRPVVSQGKLIQLSHTANEENEVTKVVLRRTNIQKVPLEDTDNNNDDNVPEFIKRQRRIQERLAKENILDFENRRSGYFTQCMLSPNTNNRQSFSPTMASPAIVPALEMSTPSTIISTIIAQTTTTTTTTATTTNVNKKLEIDWNGKVQGETCPNVIPLINGNHIECIKTVKTIKADEEEEKVADMKETAEEEEEEVAKAIEEVNKAVEGEGEVEVEVEDDDNNKYENTENMEEYYGMRCNEIEKEIQVITEKAAAIAFQKAKISNSFQY